MSQQNLLRNFYLLDRMLNYSVSNTNVKLLLIYFRNSVVQYNQYLQHIPFKLLIWELSLIKLMITYTLVYNWLRYNILYLWIKKMIFVSLFYVEYEMPIYKNNSTSLRKHTNFIVYLINYLRLHFDKLLSCSTLSSILNKKCIQYFNLFCKLPETFYTQKWSLVSLLHITELLFARIACSFQNLG